MGISKWYVTNLSKFFSKINSRAYVYTGYLAMTKCNVPVEQKFVVNRQILYLSPQKAEKLGALGFQKKKNRRFHC